MANKHAWKVEPKLIDRFLDVLSDNGFRWRTSHKANEFKPMWDDVTLLLIEEEPRTLLYVRYSTYLDESDEEYEITEVTEELLEVMEHESVVNPLVPEMLRKDIWELICDAEDEEDEEDNTHDSVNHPSHYNHGELETITIIQMLLTEEEYRGYLKGNILKYRERAPYKGNAEQDYAKAKWYFDELMTIGF